MDSDQADGTKGDGGDSVGAARPGAGGGAGSALIGTGYRRLRRKVVLSMAVVSIVPLVVMAFVTFSQYGRTLEAQSVQGVSRLMISNKRALESYLEERRSALAFIVRDRTFAELSDERVLGRIMRNLSASFPIGAFVDLGLIDSKGTQVAYRGPYRLKGHDYSSQDWFRRVSRRGVFTSDVFEGHRKTPHFVIAVRYEPGDGNWHILRATVDAEMLQEQLLTGGLGTGDDVFLVNRQGMLQTKSWRFGSVLYRLPLDLPYPSDEVKTATGTVGPGGPVLASYTAISESPFVLVFVRPHRQSALGGVQLKIFGFLLASIALILLVILWGARQFVRNIEEENIRRAALIHKVEYTNRLASIGRVAAGVAHEINNPLAIINEKAGLLKDMTSMQEDFPQRAKLQNLADSVIRAVERCTKVTHRLLGFAKRMDVHNESIDLPALIGEVVDFIGKEALHRNIQIGVERKGDIPVIESDRGQLQQVFLNLLNNALGAVKDGGTVFFTMSAPDADWVRVEVADNGVGIPRENLQRIFEPFFTTKEEGGTGLGLSITYGIVSKLGGEISVESEVGVGTKFAVSLPVKRRA